jgi:hypothetical protein
MNLAALSPSVRKLAVAVLASLLVPAACSTSGPSTMARATAEACSVFSHHYELQQIQTAASEGQKSGDTELAQEARQLQEDLTPTQDIGPPALIDVVKMTERCRQLGFPVAPP